MTKNLNKLQQPVGEPLANWQPPAHPPRESIDGHYCKLEPLDAARHAAELFEANSLASDERNWTYLPYGPFATLDEYIGWIEQACLGDDPLFYAIIDRQSAKAVGVASYLRITPAGGSIEVGHINYSPLLQRTRAATEAMYLLMKYAFELGYRRYEWKCDALNRPSRDAAQRLGLSYEGVFRQATVYRNRNRDTAWYAAIDKEWPKLDAAFTAWLDPANFDENGRQRQRLADLTAPLLVARG
ncbi:MAG: GNAT family N-acetyltransferase [Gammaproteobacteria bacterium]|nr:GNAT family N-acetyltransferase [Gammaproteobacteria bacterium]